MRSDIITLWSEGAWIAVEEALGEVDEHPFSFLGLAGQAELLQEFSQCPV